MRRKRIFAAFAAMALGASQAPGALVVTNGDFQASPGFNANVFQWFDGTNGGNPWEDTFQDVNPQAPASGTEVVFSGNQGTNPKNFFYQAIGTKEATDGTLNFSVNIGNFSSSTTHRAGTLSVGLFQSASFIGADGLDILGAVGVTQIGVMDTAFVERGGPAPNSGFETGSFSLATANLTDTIYLRFHWLMAANNAYMGADLVTITIDPAQEVETPAVPTPAALPAGLGLLGLLALRRRR